ncbi:MAG: TetR family transcriptional regulator [Chloroflexi bacterium]|jgi:AcrR family transcriptional regulator|nr:TetR family transcriptional regulator [Chloroflexota bacterium]
MTLKESIIQESMKLFSLKGFVSTGVNDILQAANTSKGGFYNHFTSKEDLFYVVLAEAQKIWREKTLDGLDDIASPLGKIEKFLENYRDRYLKDAEHFPGGCIFITFSVELDDQRPHLAAEVNKGFVGVRGMLKRLLNESQQADELDAGVDMNNVADMLFDGMLGASVVYGVDKSTASLDRSIGALIDYLQNMKMDTLVESFNA